MLVKDLIEKLQKMDENETVASALWTSTDVQGVADNEGVEITQEQINDVLEQVEDGDDSVGINWESIRCAVQNIGTPK